MPVNFKLHAIARERERAPAVKHGQGQGFTIDFTFYKVLIIMLMSLKAGYVIFQKHCRKLSRG